MSTVLSALTALSLVLQDPSTPTACPPKTTACANNSCVPIGVQCPSAGETAVASGAALPTAPAVVQEPTWDDSSAVASEVRDSGSRYRSEKFARRPVSRDGCLESIDSFERRKIIRRLTLVLPGVVALSGSLSFAIASRTTRLAADRADRDAAILSENYGLEYTGTPDYGLRNIFLAGSVLFGLAGVGLIIGGVISPKRMQRAGGSCSAQGCTLMLRF